METCQICAGAGSYTDVVEWSDGLGMVGVVCGLCDGTGITDPLPQLALRLKRELAESQRAHRDLRVAVALYLATSAGNLPEPPLADATRPSPYAETWRKELERATANLPRIS